MITDGQSDIAPDEDPGRLDLFEELSAQFGGRWTGVRFEYDGIPVGRLASSQMRLCAAIAEAFAPDFVLPASLVSCPGAKRSLGSGGCDEALVRHVHEATGISVASIAKAVEATPRLADAVVSVSLGRGFPFDVVVAYADPACVMSVLRRWQVLSKGEPLSTNISTFMAVCGNAVVAAHESGRICVSLGCSTSRQAGVLSRDEMVIAVPRRIVNVLACREMAV